MKRIIVIILIATFFLLPALEAQDIPTFDKDGFIASADIKKRLELKMVDCVAMALKNNSEILIRKIVPSIEDANILIQKSRFEPHFTFDFLMEDDRELSPVTLISQNPSKTRTGQFNFGYDQKWVTGTELDIDLYNTRTRTNSPIQDINPSFDSKAEVVITQPLLKGFGITVNKADFLIAKNNKLKSQQDFTKEVIKVLSDVKKAYYDFQYTQEQYIVAETSLKRVQNLYNINKEKYAKGLASNVDLLESEAEVARMSQALFASEEMMQQSEDNLKYATNLIDDVELWNSDIVLLDSVGYEKKEMGLVEAILKAFEHRPDYEAAKLDLKNRNLSVIFYKNNLLPTLDLIGSYGLNGLSKNYGKDLAVLGSGSYQDWTVGVSMRVPIGGNDDERGKYDKSVLEKEQALIAFKRLEQKIILEVRNAIRNIDINYKLLEASKIRKEAEEKNYEAQETRFKAGLVSTLDIIIYQERLARAEVDYVKSIIDYDMSLVELARVQGTTLLEDNIKIE